jgi:hypothetical protein
MEFAMQTLAQRFYLESEVGRLNELPKVGSALENPYVFDASAREIKAMASRGLVQIIDERHADGGEELVSRLTFLRLR